MPVIHAKAPTTEKGLVTSHLGWPYSHRSHACNLNNSGHTFAQREQVERKKYLQKINYLVKELQHPPITIFIISHNNQPSRYIYPQPQY
jgi:hypothetical protein